MKHKYDPPWLIKKVFNDFIWNSTNGKVLLTFDDGPTKETTPGILEMLDKNSIKALFFCVGQNLEKHPDLAGSIIDAGHSIGNHTYSHKVLRKLPLRKAKEEIDKFNRVYRNIFGSNPKLFRPPHGRFKVNLNKMLENREMKNVMWSLLTYDYKNDLNIVKFAVTNYLRHSSIIVLHDSRKSYPIIGKAITYIKELADTKGLEFGEPTECLK